MQHRPVIQAKIITEYTGLEETHKGHHPDPSKDHSQESNAFKSEH